MLNLFKQGDFQIDPNTTPEMLEKKRARLAAMMPSFGRARYVGEGLGQLAYGIKAGRRERQYGDFEADKRGEAAAQYGGLTAGGFGGGQTYGSTSGAAPMSILGPQGPDYSSMYPTGKDALPAGNVDPASGLDMGAEVQPDYITSLIGTESGGNWGAQNNEMGAGGKAGHFGRVQFGKARLQEAMNAGAIPQGVTPEQFMASPELQMAAEKWHFGDLESQLAPYVGTVVNGQPMTMGSLVAMGHLGGAAGARKYVESGGQYNPSDAYGTSLSDYAQTHGGNATRSASSGPAINPAVPAIPTGDLISALANPWLAPEQRAMLTGIYEQQVQAGDPMNQLALQKAQMEVDQMSQPPGPPQDYTDRLFMMKQLGIEPGTEEFKSYMLNGKLPDVAGSTEYGLTPQYGTNADGELVLVQIAKDGTAKETKLPEGIALQKGVEKLDLGTSFQWYNTLTGEPIGEPIKKDVAGEAAAGAEGKASGEDAALLASMQSKMPGLEAVVAKLEGLADEATYTYAGQALDFFGNQLGAEPRRAAVARAEYIATVDNQVLPMLRDTFGAAFTVKEGETLRATLGDPNKSPTAKKAVLRSFIEQKKRDVEALSNRVGGKTPTPAAAPTGIPDDLTPEEKAMLGIE